MIVILLFDFCAGKKSKMNQFTDLFIYVFSAVFSVMNPLGTVPVFVGLTQDYSLKEQRRTALLTAINTFSILLISFYIGNYLLSFFGISLNSLKIAGGIIIVSSGFALLTGSFNKHKGMEEKAIQNEMKTRQSVSLTPLAIPMLAGPGTISLLISMKSQHSLLQEQILIVTALLFVCIVTFLILRSSQHIVKILGASGLNAVARIIGFIVIAIGIEYISSSIQQLLKV